MNMNQLFNMFTRLVARRAMNWGINKGMSTLSRNKGQAPDAGPRTPQDKAQSKQTQDMARKMRTLGRMTRR
ncbi:hypothetical protein [Paracoccus hibiscisoli]|uniref:Uncharacterized protein n=1 Tax=Paracoccus hibiscisoli TaxID=2023261 RepID=A0A4V5MTP6_9RHOB|nr:hypothetical protein [Paracoccus hibiscisoli]TJZ84978.1 hypothetical protein FA740_08500 [Paracoccus hibiscisoli]